MKVKIIITLIFALLLAVFALFNRQPTEILFVRFRILEVPLHLIVIWSFVAGAIYTALIALMGRVKQAEKTRQFKTRIEELENKR